MSVYVIRRNGDPTGPVKIGFAVDVNKRLSAMMTALPEGFEILHCLDGDRNLEKALHKHFESKRWNREWFNLTAEEIAWIPSFRGEGVHDSRLRHIPSPADEFSENIIHETRFYLNELVKREWRGIGDSVEDALGRVMEFCELEKSYGFRLWQKYQDMKDVNGEPYRCLRLAYAMKLREEGRLNDNQDRFLRTMARTYRNSPSLRAMEGFGVQYIVGLIDRYFPDVPAEGPGR